MFRDEGYPTPCGRASPGSFDVSDVHELVLVNRLSKAHLLDGMSRNHVRKQCSRGELYVA